MAPAHAGCMKEGPSGPYFEGNAALCPGQGGNQPAHQNHFAAIAISTADYTIWGTSWGYATRNAAERAAIQRCKAKDCTAQMWGQGRCIALAETTNADYYGVGAGIYPGNAEADAIRVCQAAAKARCVVITHPCSED